MKTVISCFLCLVYNILWGTALSVHISIWIIIMPIHQQTFFLATDLGGPASGAFMHFDDTHPGEGTWDQMDPSTGVIFHGDPGYAPWTILSVGDTILMRETAPNKPLMARAIGKYNIKVDPKPTGLNRVTLLKQRHVTDPTGSKIVRLGQVRIEFTSSNLATDSERVLVLNDAIAALLDLRVQTLITTLQPIFI